MSHGLVEGERWLLTFDKELEPDADGNTTRWTSCFEATAFAVMDGGQGIPVIVGIREEVNPTSKLKETTQINCDLSELVSITRIAVA